MIILVSAVLGAALVSGEAIAPRPDEPPDYRQDFNLVVENLPSMTRAEIEMFYAHAVDVPLVRLLSMPSEFDGKAVRTCGVYRHALEGTALYMNRESFTYRLSANAVFAFTTHSDDALLKKLHGNFVCMTGVFLASSGSMNFPSSGQLKDVAPLAMADMILPSE